MMFSTIALSILLVAALFAVGIIYMLGGLGALPITVELQELAPAIWIAMGISFVIGLVLSLIAVRFPLKPFTQMVNCMNLLASGKYGTRLDFSGMYKHQASYKQMSESFNKLAEQLEKTEMLRSDFVNNFSHEFKTPIVSIAGFAKLLKRGNLTEEQKLDYVNIIEEESLRLSYMATNMLHLTKAENQTILTDGSEFNLSEQIRSSVLLLEDKWSRKDVQFELEFDEYRVEANEELLKQVWINLLDNAVKFSPCGGTVTVAIAKKGENIRVSVTNEGPEIPEDKKGRIFDKFYQVEESHASEGNGIGLAVVKHIIKLHKGSVGVSSEGGKNTFSVELPSRLDG